MSETAGEIPPTNAISSTVIEQTDIMTMQSLLGISDVVITYYIDIDDLANSDSWSQRIKVEMSLCKCGIDVYTIWNGSIP